MDSLPSEQTMSKSEKAYITFQKNEEVYKSQNQLLYGLQLCLIFLFFLVAVNALLSPATQCG